MNILLCCCVGMSTSLLVSKMKKSAIEQGIECKIWAVPADTVIKQIDQADVILLGPQVRFMLKDMRKLCLAKGVPIEVIDTVQYGTFNGQEVLKLAKQLHYSNRKDELK
nr:PTS sugar transporter subunit IIB [Neobacillus sp. Marseille-Q6967]